MNGTNKVTASRHAIFTGGTIRTMRERGEAVEAVLVVDDRIAATGSLSEVKRAAEELILGEPNVVDIAGQTMFPGFVDPHAHPLMHGQTMSWIDCSPQAASSIPEIIEILRNAAERIPPEIPIRGYGYQQRNLVERRHPTRDDLDAASLDREVYLMNASGHGGAVNSITLARRGITRDTPDPEGGSFARSQDGEPNGQLLDAACDILTGPDGVKLGSHGPNFHLDDSPGALLDQFLHAQADFIRHGVTTVGDAQVSKREMAVYQHAERDGKLRARYTVYFLSHVLDELLQLGLQSGLGTERLRLGGVKFYVDGTLGGSTAYFPEGYQHDKCQHGQLYHSAEEFKRMLASAHQAGLQTASHAQSPAAIDIVLDAIDSAQAERGRPVVPHRIEHAGLALTEQVRRMASLAVSTVSQPQHYYGWGEGIVESVGALGGRYNPLSEYVEHGVAFALSSDAPVAPPRPLLAAEIAATRKTQRGTTYEPQLGISVEDALYASTLGAASMLGRGDAVGSLEAGKFADFILLSHDPLGVPVEQVHEVQVTETWIGGHREY